MLRLRSIWLPALALGAVALLTTPARAADAREGTGAVLDVLTPTDAQIVVSFNLRQMADSALAKKKGIDKLREALDADQNLKQVLKAVGLDPFKDIESITLALPIPENPAVKTDKVFVTIRGNFDQDK